MADLPWNIEIIRWLAEHRTDWLTTIFQFFTFLGNEQGYILIVLGLYWLLDKRVALQVALAVLFSALLNHILKIIIRNPRPFVNEGSYRENWALPEGDIEETVHSFSTPSGHAQGSSTFWWYLHLKLKSRVTFVLLPIMVLAIGISRPYLGVHYVEDILIGWVVGFLVVVLLHRYDEPIANWWNQLSEALRTLIAIAVPLLVMIVAGFIADFGPDGQAFATLGGMFTGIVIGYSLQQKKLSFQPSLSHYDGAVMKIGIAISRMLLGIVIVALFLIGLDEVFALISGDDSLVGFVLRYIRYTSVGLAGTYLAPLIFEKLKLAKPVAE